MSEAEQTKQRQAIDGRLRYVWSPNLVEPTVYEVIDRDGNVQARGHLRVLGSGPVIFEPLVPQG